LINLFRRLFPKTKTRLVRVRAKYDAAQTTYDNQRHWAAADDLSAKSANNAHVRRQLRKRSRYEISNNSYARGIVSTLANYTIGSGPTPGITYLGNMLERQDVSELSAVVMRLFHEWWQEAEIQNKLATAGETVPRDGEAFFTKYTSANPFWRSPVRLNVRLLEADQFETDNLQGQLGSDESGVELDQNGDIMAYYLLPYHPGDTFSPIQSAIRISARDVYHLYRADRPGQLRGIPWLTPSLNIFAQLRRFVLATLTAAETAADHAAVLEQMAGADDEDQAEPWERMEIERGAMVTLPAGAKLSQFKAEHPNATFEQFITSMVREAARCVDMPAVLAIDASKYNYASGRLDLQAFWRTRGAERVLIYERQFLDPLWRDWLDEALLIPGYLPDLFAETAYDWAPLWRWSEAEHVDRAKEAAGQAAELANHTTTLAREYARRGLDWEDELKQRARELELMRELGLTAAQAQPQPQTQPQPQPIEQPEEIEDSPEDEIEDDLEDSVEDSPDEQV
jgi:lambda family phage portal protein